MRILLLNSALTLMLGTPRQRAAYALRSDLSNFGSVSVMTVDCWNTEWHSRRKCPAGDTFFGHALPQHLGKKDAFLDWPNRDPNLSLSQGVDINDRDDHQEPDQSGWNSAKRQARLSAEIARHAPDLLVCADQMLWSLASACCPENTHLVYLDQDDEAFAEMMQGSLQAPTSLAWFSMFQSELIRNRAALASNAHVIKAKQRIVQEESDLFMNKSDKALFVGSGLPWLDDQAVKRILDRLERSPRTSPLLEKLVLFGFTASQSQAAARAGAEQHTAWTRLHTALGISRCLVLPFVTPTLLPLIEAALKVGTPVLLSLGDVDAYGYQNRTGVYATSRDAFVLAVAEILSGDFASPAFSQAIANESKALQFDDGADQLQSLLAESLGQKISRSNAQFSLLAPRRSPLVMPIEVLYEPIKQLLLIRAEIWGWSNLEDIRLANGKGKELTRLAPNAHQQAQGRYLLEGGLVVPLKELGKMLTVSGYTDTQELFSIEIEASDFRQIDCGMVIAEFVDGGVTGAFWVKHDAASDRWMVRAGQEQTVASADQGQDVPGLGVRIIPFRATSHHGRGGRQNVELVREHSGSRRLEIPPQSTLTATTSKLNTKRHNTAILNLKDVHKGKRGWIIGNGPSVRLEDLSRIPEGDIIFCFNRFYLSYNDTALREDYVVSADTLMIEDFGQEMIDIANGLPLFCMPPNATNHLSGPFVSLLPGDASVPLFSFDPDCYVSVGGSSVYVAIQMAWHMGLRDLTLYGMDYSFSASLHRDPRYPFPVAYNDDNHFIKGYRDAKPWCPPTWRDISAGFLNARLAYEMTGGRIINATRGGKLELFERADFDLLIPGKQ
jgi:hypothetical protein